MIFIFIYFVGSLMSVFFTLMIIKLTHNPAVKEDIKENILAIIAAVILSWIGLLILLCVSASIWKIYK